MEAGSDLDFDGMLDANEVTSTTVLCNGVSCEAGLAGQAGAPAPGRILVRLVDAPVDGGRAGRRVEAGTDADVDGMLDGAEVSSVPASAALRAELRANREARAGRCAQATRFFAGRRPLVFAGFTSWAASTRPGARH